MCAKYYELRCTFYKKKLHSSKLAHLLDTASKFALFSVSGFKDKKLIKSKPAQKLKHANSILEHLEYFFQISSKSIFIILSYTVSNLAHFLRHSVHPEIFTECIWGSKNATYKGKECRTS